MTHRHASTRALTRAALVCIVLAVAALAAGAMLADTPIPPPVPTAPTVDAMARDCGVMRF